MWRISNPAPDRPEDEETLNEELWRFAKRTSYEAAELHIEKVRKGKRPDRAQMILPSGWKIAPAGRRVQVGRLPGEAVFYSGHIVALNTGYYVK